MDNYLTHRATLTRKVNFVPETLTDEIISVNEQVQEDGRFLLKRTFKQVSPSKRYEGLKVSDFALESLIAVGDVGKLSEVNIPTPRSYLDTVPSNLEGLAEKLEQSSQVEPEKSDESVS